MNRLTSTSLLSADESLDDLRRRKNEVISKIVQKRIVQPSPEPTDTTSNDSLPPSSFSSQSMKSECNYILQISAPHIVRPSAAQSMTTNTSKTSTMSDIDTDSLLLRNLLKTSDGHYSLWTGLSCIPSLSGLSFQDSLDNPAAIESVNYVTADLGTKTMNVPASAGFHHNSSATTNSSSYHSDSYSKYTEDDILPIQDLRIVSKYGPIARTVRSNTTSATPEQVTANGNAKTQPLPSDTNPKETRITTDNTDNFWDIDPLICMDVEPTITEQSWNLSGNGSYDSSSSPRHHKKAESYLLLQNHHQSKAGLSNEIEDEREDLMLAIELQQIEIGIQKKLQEQKDIMT